MTVDRLNDHVRRATGVTAGHLIRQRVLTEAKRQLVFTSQPIHEIAYDLANSLIPLARAVLRSSRHDTARVSGTRAAGAGARSADGEPQGLHSSLLPLLNTGN